MKRIILSLFVLMTLVSFSAYAQMNKVLSLDGDGDYVEIVDSPTLNDIESQVTIETWIRIDSFTGAWYPIIYKGDEREEGLSNRSYVLWLNHNGYIHLTSAPTGEGQIQLSSPYDSIKIGIWYHVVGVVDTENGYMKIYINGIEVASRDSGDDIRTSTLPLLIGDDSENYPGHSDISGYLDEIRIWNVARTPEQIQSAMNTTLIGNEDGLVGYWNFDDGTVDDLTANNNDGTLNGDAQIVEQSIPQVWFVSPSGNDANDGAKTRPFRTIQYAINQAGHYDIITALPGTYEENITLLGDLTLQGSGAEATIITASSGNVVTANNVYNVTLSGFTIDGQGTADSGIFGDGDSE